MSTPGLRETRDYKNYIDGQWIATSAGKTFENRSPADNDDLIGTFQESNADDLNAAVDAADRAFNSWRLTPAPIRADYLYAVGNILKRDKEAIATEMTREMGKVLQETRGDVQEAIDMAFLMAGEGRRLHGVTTPSELPNKFNMAVRMPLGVAGLITPWNFPIAIPAWKSMAALICGNTVVIKPASQTPLSVVMLAEAFAEAGLPRGVFNVVTGGGKEVGAPMLTHPKVAVISFTGSTDVGREISIACAPQFKHVHLEMGGKNVILVMDDADVDLAVDGALWGAFGTAGQRCTAASRIVAHRKVYDEFVSKLSARAKSLRVGNGLDPQTDMGPNISKSQIKTISKYVKIGTDEGATVTAGGATLTDGAFAKGYFHQPTVFADVSNDWRIAREEIFGPVLSFIRARDYSHALAIANGTEYGLTGGVYSNNRRHLDRARSEFQVGNLYFNRKITGAMVGAQPFGGFDMSGTDSKAGGPDYLQLFMQAKVVVERF